MSSRNGGTPKPTAGGTIRKSSAIWAISAICNLTLTEHADDITANGSERSSRIVAVGLYLDHVSSASWDCDTMKINLRSNRLECHFAIFVGFVLETNLIPGTQLVRRHK